MPGAEGVGDKGEERGMSVRSFCLGLSMSVGLMCQSGSGFANEKPDPQKAEAGEQIYGDYCQTCHGDNLVSNGQTFDLRRLTPAERRRFETSVENGKGQMPPWRGVIDPEQIDKIWHFIMSKRG
jgi:cytochrome c55X